MIGHLSNNINCEIKGISIGLDLALSQFKEKEDPNYKLVFICCDCVSAIDVVSKQQSFENHAKSLREINGQVKELKVWGIKPYLIWWPAHCNIDYNEMVDKIASDAAKGGNPESDNPPISKVERFKIINDLVKKEWKTQWRMSTSGNHTKELITDLSSKLGSLKTELLVYLMFEPYLAIPS